MPYIMCIQLVAGIEGHFQMFELIDSQCELIKLSTEKRFTWQNATPTNTYIWARDWGREREWGRAEEGNTAGWRAIHKRARKELRGIKQMNDR